MHQSSRQSAICSRSDDDLMVGLFHCAGFININHHDFRATLFTGTNGVGHDIDLRCNWVGSPNDNAIRLRHLTRINTTEPACTNHVARKSGRGANGGMLLRIAQNIAEPVDAIPLNQPHCTSEIVRPNGFSTIFVRGFQKSFCHFIQRVFKGNFLKLTITARTNASIRLCQTVRMVDAFGIAGNFGANNACGIGIFSRTTHA